MLVRIKIEDRKKGARAGESFVLDSLHTPRLDRL